MHAGLLYTVSWGMFTPGRMAEVFITAEKTSSLAESIARDAAIGISIALQYGAPLETLRIAMTRDEKGGAATVAGAALDLISSVIGEAS